MGGPISQYGLQAVRILMMKIQDEVYGQLAYGDQRNSPLTNGPYPMGKPPSSVYPQLAAPLCSSSGI